MNYYAIVQFINAILFFSIGLFIYLNDKKSKLHKTFFLFCLSGAVWMGCYVIWLFAASYTAGLFWIRTLHIGAIFIPTTYLHHILIFLGYGNEDRKKLFIKICYVLSFFFLSISYSPIFIKDVTQKLSFPYWPEPGPAYHFYIIYLVGSSLYSWYLMAKKYKSTSGKKEQDQIKYVLIASMLAFIGGETNFFLFYNIQIPPVGDFLMVLYPIGIAYVILRHKLFGITIIIRKGLVYSMLGTIVTSIFFALMLVIEKFFQGLVGYQTLFVTLVVGFLLTFGFTPLKNFLQRFVDRRFFHGTLEEIATENEHLHQEMLKQDRIKAVATLAASMAHEIKNPLTVIKTYTDFLPERHEDEKFISDFVRLVKPQVEKINFTVQQLLDFSKQSIPDLKPVNIHHVITEVLEFLSGDFLKSRIMPQIQFSNDDVIILADNNQLKQVFLNLFLNAIDAMPRGGRLIVSGSLGSDKNANPQNNSKFLEVHIKDTGEGISQENLKRIFNPFFTTKPTGTGLGLSVVHDILEQHKATIKAESEKGEGATFVIRFPVIKISTSPYQVV